MKTPTTFRGAAVGIAALVLVAGCGSRANFSSGPAGSASASVARGGGDSSLGSTVAGTAGGSGSAPVTTASSGGSSGPAPGESSGPAGSSGGPAAASSTGSTGSTGSTVASGSSGSTTTPPSGGPPIRVGYVIADTTGVSGLTGTNINASTAAEQREMQALLTYANSQGGVGGRKLVGVPITIGDTSTGAQRLTDCTSMTEDAHDQVVIDQNLFLQEAEWSCFAEHHVDYVGNVTGTDRAFLASVSPYITTTYLALDRQMTAMAQGAASVGYFKGGKVGILLPDTPAAHHDYTDTFVPALAADGVTNPDVRFITEDASGDSQESQTADAVLDFSSKGINRIMFFHDILVYLLFTVQAQVQDYHPVYAFPDFEGAAGIAAFYGSAGQNANAIAVSSYSVDDNDSRSSTDTTSPINRATASPGERRCLDVISQETHSNYYDPASSGGSGLETYYCDEFFTWWDAARLVGAGWTPANFGQGLKALGTSEQSPLQHSTDFSSGNHDGASSYRVGRFNSTCGCFVEISSWLPIAT